MISEECAAHREQLVDGFVEAFRPKYDHGQREHGGRVWLKPNMLREAKHEVLDLWVYLSCEEQQKLRARRLLAEALTEQDWSKVGQAFAVLQSGNEDAVPEEDR